MESRPPVKARYAPPAELNDVAIPRVSCCFAGRTVCMLDSYCAATELLDADTTTVTAHILLEHAYGTDWVFARITPYGRAVLGDTAELGASLFVTPQIFTKLLRMPDGRFHRLRQPQKEIAAAVAQAIISSGSVDSKLPQAREVVTKTAKGWSGLRAAAKWQSEKAVADRAAEEQQPKLHRVARLDSFGSLQYRAMLATLGLVMLLMLGALTYQWYHMAESGIEQPGGCSWLADYACARVDSCQLAQS